VRTNPKVTDSMHVALQHNERPGQVRQQLATSSSAERCTHVTADNSTVSDDAIQRLLDFVRQRAPEHVEYFQKHVVTKLNNNMQVCCRSLRGPILHYCYSATKFGETIAGNRFLRFFSITITYRISVYQHSILCYF